ncbi:hypothetical protein FXF51_21055 [Nonomuraea sp. PA05]|uniref:hypothetical protein n=1 Tax=Nonomuraea sp. PA05 TaxID=2604466 RepID=UPI0011D4D496|nr:hypothetical protein [Nonomuraea sp. PA05]TYB64231.1 hypothetical protein FXF51_21055 [Nonomuraea sp. PA05]
MGKDLVRGAAVGLAAGLVLAHPVAQTYRPDVLDYVAHINVVLAVSVVVPAGWLLAHLLRITHPVRAALLAPLLLLVAKNAADLTVTSPSPELVAFAFTALAVFSYATAAALTATTSRLPRGVAAAAVSVCVIASATVQQQRDEAMDRRFREELTALYAASLPLVVPEEVPGRTLAHVWTISDEVLALDYAVNRASEPDVFVQISTGDPAASCAEWVRESADGCERLAADRWLVTTGGRMVLFTTSGKHLVQVDSAALARDDLLTVGGALRQVTAGYLAALS